MIRCVEGVVSSIGREITGGAEMEEALASDLSDNALVCRGGTCTADRFANGSGVTIGAGAVINCGFHPMNFTL
jgi:hypothetical protein